MTWGVKHLWWVITTPAGISLLKVNNRNTRARCEICSKLTIKIPERRHWVVVGVGWWWGFLELFHSFTPWFQSESDSEILYHQMTLISVSHLNAKIGIAPTNVVEEVWIFGIFPQKTVSRNGTAFSCGQVQTSQAWLPSKKQSLLISKHFRRVLFQMLVMLV